MIVASVFTFACATPIADRSNPAQTLSQRGRPIKFFYRDLTLQPGEEISFVERLDYYIERLAMGTYTVRTEFYPELIRNPTTLQANPISLRIRGGRTPTRQREQLITALIEEQLTRESLSPDQIVSFLIEARRQGNWGSFLALSESGTALPKRTKP